MNKKLLMYLFIIGFLELFMTYIFDIIIQFLMFRMIMVDFGG